MGLISWVLHSHVQAREGASACLVVRPLGSKGVVELDEGELTSWHNPLAPRLIGPTKLGSVRECPEESQEKVGGVPAGVEINSTYSRRVFFFSLSTLKIHFTLKIPDMQKWGQQGSEVGFGLGREDLSIGQGLIRRQGLEEGLRDQRAQVPED